MLLKWGSNFLGNHPAFTALPVLGSKAPLENPSTRAQQTQKFMQNTLLHGQIPPPVHSPPRAPLLLFGPTLLPAWAALTLIGMLDCADLCCQVTKRFSIFICFSSSGGKRAAIDVSSYIPKYCHCISLPSSSLYLHRPQPIPLPHRNSSELPPLPELPVCSF